MHPVPSAQKKSELQESYSGDMCNTQFTKTVKIGMKGIYLLKSCFEFAHLLTRKREWIETYS